MNIYIPKLASDNNYLCNLVEIELIVSDKFVHNPLVKLLNKLLINQIFLYFLCLTPLLKLELDDTICHG